MVQGPSRAGYSSVLVVLVHLVVKQDHNTIPEVRPRLEQGVPVIPSLVCGNERAESVERLESAIWLADTLENKGWNAEIDAVSDAGLQIVWQGPQVEE